MTDTYQPTSYLADLADWQSWMLDAAKRLQTRLERDVEQIVQEDMTAAQAAHLYVAVRRAAEAFGEALKPITGLQQKLNNDLVPEAFEREKISSFTTSDGYRATVSNALRVSILPDTKGEAFEWLRSNGLDALVIETVNASTLSAAGRHLLEDGKELPEDLFRAYYQQATSITKVK